MINFSKIMKKAFTLSEVLLVVGIIGVVAALTIPNLNKGVNEDKFALLFRSTIDQLNVAYGKMVSEYGYNDLTVDCSSSDNITCFGDKLTKYLDVKLNCKVSDADKCFIDSPLYEFDGSEATRDGGGYSFILQNGVSVYLRSWSYFGSAIDVDLDGPQKGLNRRGYDIFQLKRDEDISFYVNEHDNGINKGSNGKLLANDLTGYYDFYSEWLYRIGNLDYLKCPDNLNWINKHSCD